jgi:very-short-patch-repair endonuclease
VIEVDGSQHREPENLAKDRKRDRKRDADLANLGLTVLRSCHEITFTSNADCGCMS